MELLSTGLKAIILEEGVEVGPSIRSRARFGCLRQAPIFSHKMLPQSTPGGMILFFHGVKQHSCGPEVISLARHIISKACCAWFAWDMQGHGMSGKLGDPLHSIPAATIVTSCKNLLKEALEWLAKVVSTHPNLPFCVSGHSFGGGIVVAISKIIEKQYRNQFAGFCVSAPLVLSKMLVDQPSSGLLVRCGKKCVASLRPDFTPNVPAAELTSSVRRRSVAKMLSSDSRRFQHTSLPIGTIMASNEIVMMNSQFAHLIGINVPFCICHGDKDTVNMIEGSKLVLALSSTPEWKKKLIIFKGAKHNLLADLMKDSTFCNCWSIFFADAFSGKFISGDMHEHSVNHILVDTTYILDTMHLS